jgi:hypothetical protein
LVEKASSRLRAVLRKIGERTVSGLGTSINKTADILQLAECLNHFSPYGYDPD